MKKVCFLLSLVSVLSAFACEKSGSNPGIPSGGPRNSVPSELCANWMHGEFSLTEYWSQDPASYIGNALEFAFAFTFNSDGTYTQYFTSSSVMNGVTTYQQSVTHGTMEINTGTKTIKTHAVSSHYRRTSNKRIVEDRDLRPEELSAATLYNYALGSESNGAAALHLTLNGTAEPLTFLKN